ncbi:MAG TPA: hypothetical protein DEF89_01535, partial [Desulfosporosinus sp.]|nr:hypothetical protein [Desulfosporosinus sp.]
ESYDWIKFIQEPCASVQEEAVKINYDALRYINSPTHQAELTAIKNNERAITFINDLDQHKILEFLQVNSLVINYVMNEISKDELEQVLKASLANEDVEEKYVRDFLNCSYIHQNSDLMPMDKIMFIYKYGSKKAKKIAVDEKLKML